MATHSNRLPLLVTLLATVCAADARAQTASTSVQVWPELSTFVKLTPKARLYFLATTVKENRDSTSGEFGPNLDIYARPFRDRKHFRGFKLDESKNQTVLIRIGYRYLPNFGAVDDPAENRGVFEATARHPLMSGVLASTRNRFDLRFIDGTYSWRYRNRVSFERECTLGKVTLNPYVRAEIFYDSRVNDWSRTGFTGGAAFPVNRRLELESYYTYEHDTSGSPRRKLHAIGAVLNLYFR